MKIGIDHNEKSDKAIVALKEVYDPEIGLNVVDLGLIYRIDLDEESRTVKVTMTLTTQYCPMGESIVENVYGAMQEVFDDYETEVELTFDPPWNSDMITEAGIEFLQGF